MLHGGILSGSTILRFLFPHSAVAQRPITDLDLYFTCTSLPAVRDFLIGAGFKAVGHPIPDHIFFYDQTTVPLGDALLNATIDGYDDIPLIHSVYRYERNGKLLDIIGCNDSVSRLPRVTAVILIREIQPSAVVEQYYCTLVMNAWTGDRLFCYEPHLTFNNEFMVHRDNPKGQELIQTKWLPCSFKLVEGPLPRQSRPWHVWLLIGFVTIRLTRSFSSIPLDLRSTTKAAGVGRPSSYRPRMRYVDDSWGRWGFGCQRRRVGMNS